MQMTLANAANHFNNKKYDAAVEACVACLNTYSNNPDLWSILGLSLLQLERYEESLDALSKANTLSPDNQEIILNRFVAMHKTGHSFQASTELLTTLKDTERFSPLLKLRGLRQFIYFLEAAERNKRQEYGKPVYHVTTDEELGFNHVDGLDRQIMPVAEHLLEHLSDNPSLYDLLGSFHFNDGNFAQSEEYYIRSYELDPVGFHRSVTRRLSSTFFHKLDETSVSDTRNRLPHLQWQNPDFHPTKPVLYLSCDGNYFSYFGLAMLSSIDLNTTSVDVHLNLINANDTQKRLADEIRRKARQVQINITYELFPTDGLSNEAIVGYYGASRFVRYLELLSRYDVPIVNMDVDGLVMNDFAPLLEVAVGKDLALRGRPGRFEPWNQYAAATIIIAPTTNGKLFAELLLKYIGYFLQHNLGFWTLDQMALFACLHQMKQRQQAPTTAFLNEKYIELGPYTSEGTVWQTAGRTKWQQAKHALNVDISNVDSLDPYAKEFRRYHTLYLDS